MSNKLLWMALLAAILIGMAWQFYPLPNAEIRVNSLPSQGVNFMGKDVPLNKTEEQLFQHVGVLKRLYRIDNNYFLLTVLDGTHNRHVVHDPYYCFQGSGWNIIDSKTMTLAKGQAVLVTIKKGDQSRQALYWFSNGSEQFISPMEYWKDTTLRRLTFGASGEEPILIMLQPTDDRPVDWNAILTTFYPVLKI